MSYESGKVREYSMRKELQRIMDYFSQRLEVRTLFLFGTFDTPFEREDSDIDIAVVVNPAITKDALESLKKEYYAASTGFSLKCTDIVILNSAPAPIKHRVLKTGRLIIDRDPEYRKHFTASAIQEYFDYNFIEDIYFDKMGKRLRRAAGG